MEFLGNRCERSDRGFSIVGRCCVGPIQIGDRFHAAARTTFQKQGAQFISEQHEHLGEVDLRVESIENYGKSFTSLPDGWTCLMTVSGTDNGLLGANVTLVG